MYAGTVIRIQLRKREGRIRTCNASDLCAGFLDIRHKVGAKSADIHEAVHLLLVLCG